jgi:pectinesterase
MGHATFSSAVQGIVTIDGVINFLAPSSLNIDRGPESADVQWLGGTFSEAPDLWKEVSPIYWANERSVPILFLNSGIPKYHAGQDELTGMYREWGIYHEVHQFNVRVHTFWHFHQFIDESVSYMENFMNRIFLQGVDSR